MATTDRNPLQQVRDLIRDIDSVEFGRLPGLLNDMAVHCDRALSERADLIAALRKLVAWQGFNGEVAALIAAHNLLTKVEG